MKTWSKSETQYHIKIIKSYETGLHFIQDEKSFMII
jgi:hypothetical protein